MKIIEDSDPQTRLFVPTAKMKSVPLTLDTAVRKTYQLKAIAF